MAKTNRQRVRESKRGMGWCQCDMAFVDNQKKCPACGRRNGRLRNKKPGPVIDEWLAED